MKLKMYAVQENLQRKWFFVVERNVSSDMWNLNLLGTNVWKNEGFFYWILS